jgi:hypothetical protein
MWPTLDQMEANYLQPTREKLGGIPGSRRLLERLAEGDQAAKSELTAIHLLWSRKPEATVEIEPEVLVLDRLRHPDFRIRPQGAWPWAYVEVAKLNRSSAFTQTEELLNQLAENVCSGSATDRDPTTTFGKNGGGC